MGRPFGVPFGVKGKMSTALQRQAEPPANMTIFACAITIVGRCSRLHACLSSQGERDVSLQPKLIRLHIGHGMACRGVKPVWAAAIMPTVLSAGNRPYLHLVTIRLA